MFEVLTGFKFIGEVIRQFEINNNSHEYLFGFEESYGYLAGTYARDKDAVVASLLIAEMAVYYKYEKGLSLFAQLQEIYKKYGYYLEENISVTMEGITGADKILQIMSDLRENPPTELGGLKVLAIRDYKTSERTVIGGETEPIYLPKSNVLYFELENKNAFVVRPSGTEPKIKFYCLLCGENEAEAKSILERCKENVMRIKA